MHAEVFRIKVSWRLQLALMVQLPSTHTYTHGVSLGTLISRCQDGIRYIGDSSRGGEIPAKNKGERREVGEGVQTTGQADTCEGEGEGWGIRQEESQAIVQFQKGLASLMGSPQANVTC